MSQGANTLGAFAIQTPDELANLHDKAIAIHEIGQTWETRAVEIQAASTTLLQGIQKEIATLQQEAADHQAQLESELQELNSSVESAKEHARAAYTQLGISVQDLVANLSEIQRQVDQGHTALREKTDEVQQVIEPFEQAVRQQQEHVLTVMASVEEFAATLSNEIQNGKESVAQHIQQLVDSISTAKEEASTHLQTAEEEISAARESLGQKLTEIAGLVEAQIGEVTDASKQFLDDKLQTLIKDAVNELAEVVQSLGTRMSDASAESSEIRQILEPVIEEVQSYLDPIQDGLAAAQNAAAKVGISWG